MKYLIPLLLEEQGAQAALFTHVAPISVDLLTEPTANTPQTLTLFTAPKGWIMGKAMVVLPKAFKASADAAFNTTTLIVGDAGSANRYVTSTELNENGTEITIPSYFNTSYQFTADTPILAKFTGMAAQSLSALDVGEVHIFFQLMDSKILSELQGSSVLVGT